MWPSAKLLTFSESPCAHLWNEDINTSSSSLCQITDRIYTNVSGTEPDTLPSSPDLPLATFTSCLTLHQAQCPSHAELGFVAIWLAHMMLVIKGLSKKLWLLFPEGVTKEFSWCPTFCPAQESLSAQTLSWKGIHLSWELLNISPIPTVCRNCSIWTVHYDPRKEMAGKENPGERDRKTIQGIWHSACICKFTREKQSLPEKPFNNMWASRTKFFPWIRVRSKKGTQVKKEKNTRHKIPWEIRTPLNQTENGSDILSNPHQLRITSNCLFADLFCQWEGRWNEYQNPVQALVISFL